MAGELKIQTEEHHPLVILTLTGELGQLAVYKFKSVSETLVKDGNKFIILDMKGVSHIDSAGIGVVVNLRNSCHKAGGGLGVVISGQNQVQRAFEISSLGKIIQFSHSLDIVMAEMNAKFGVRRPTLKAVETSVSSDLTEAVRGLSARLKRVEERLSKIEEKLEIT